MRLLPVLLVPLALTCCGPSSTVRLSLDPNSQLEFAGVRGAVTLGPINDAGIAPVVEALRAHPPTLNILIDSGGGYVSSGWQLIGEIEEAQAAGTIVICSVDRLAASMAAVIFESCDLRLMRKGAALLFHTASASNVSGNQWDFERMARELDAINARIAIYVTGRLTISQTDYERNVSDRDWWLGTEGALEIGAIDEALPPLRR